MLGGGVIGLSTAIRLQEAGHAVKIWAQELPPHTTSNVAGAIWYPYKALPEEKVRHWGRVTLKALCALALDPLSGVVITEGKKIFHRPMGNPWWMKDVPTFRRLTPEELGEGRVAGYAFSVPVADMSHYLTTYLLSRFKAAFGTVELRRVESLDEPLAAYRRVVNCTGLGARELAGDASLYPIRGHVARVEKSGLSEFLLDTDNPAGVIYVIPRARDCIVGGIADDNEWSLTPDVATGERMLKRCAAVLPAIGSAKVLEHRVGLRPGRNAVRLEVETRGDRVLIHNYGHGGAGVTLSWGCADEVVALLSPFL